MKNSNFTNEYSQLKRISLQFITEKEFDKIDRTSVRLQFKKGETILKQGNIPTNVIYLETGVVKFSYENDWGKNLILTIVGAPKILGGANLFYKDNNLFSIVALEDCDIILIDSKILESVLMDNSRYAMVMFQIASEMFKQSILNFISLAYKQKEGRVADIILYLAKEVYHGYSFQVSLTRKELAEYAGCSVENVIMTLSKWQNEEIISLDKKMIKIIDSEKLKFISKIG